MGEDGCQVVLAEKPLMFCRWGGNISQDIFCTAQYYILDLMSVTGTRSYSVYCLKIILYSVVSTNITTILV